VKAEDILEVKLYVGNLSYDTGEEQLRTLFATAGTVSSVEMITDRDTHRSKGFAFVTMSTQAEAESAIKQFNGKEVDGRALAVNAARPREDRPMGGGGGRSSYGDKNRRNNNRGGGGQKRY
jgi:RNA recognition motif-containing protein